MLTMDQMKEETVLSFFDRHFLYAYNEIKKAGKPVIKRERVYVPLEVYADIFYFDYRFDHRMRIAELFQGSRHIKLDARRQQASLDGKKIALAGEILCVDKDIYVAGEDAAIFFKRYVCTGEDYILFSRLDVKSMAESRALQQYVQYLKTVGTPGEASYIFVSPEGDDQDDGSFEKPYRTLEKVKSVVRGRVDDAKGDIVVTLRGGDYFLDEPLRFTEKDSGKNFNKVVYRAYPDEVPVIKGGWKVKGWEASENGIFRAKMEQGRQFEMLTENNVKGNLARYPNHDYSQVVGRPGKEYKSSFIFTENLPEIKKLDELRVYIWPGGDTGEWNWFTQEIPVKEIAYGTKTVYLTEEVLYNLGTGSRYYFKGARELLDEPGEFYADKEEGYLYYKPRNMPIEEQTIIVSKVDHLVEFVPSYTDVYARNIIFENIELQNAEKSGIRMDCAANIEIASCRIHHVGGHGIHINNTCRNNAVKNCEISNFGHTGVMLTGNNLSRNDINRGHVIFNNHIYNGGLAVGFGAGIAIEESGDNVVMHNEIHHMPRYGINIKELRPGILIGHKVGEETITRGNVREFLHTKNNIVQYNRMYALNNDSQDSGAINSWGAGSTDKRHCNVIAHNWMHDFDVKFSFGFGIYLDDAADGYDVAYNLINRFNHHGGGKVNGMIFGKGIENVFRNNIAADVKRSGAALLTQEMAGDYNHDISSVNNIFYNYGFHFYDCYGDFPENRFKASDMNIFYKDEGGYFNGGVPNIRTLQEWQNFRGGRFDRNTATEDPMFMDPARSDYRLRYNSPAYRLGIKDILCGEIGLLPDFRYVKEEVTANLFFKADGREIAGSALSIKSGESIAIGMFGRTASGAFYVEIPDTEISYRMHSDHAEVCAGVVTAKKEGVAKLTATVNSKGKMMESTVYFLIDEVMSGVGAIVDYTESDLPRALAIGGKAQIKPFVVTQYRQFAADYDFPTNCKYKAMNGFAEVDDMGTLAGKSEGPARIEVTAERNGVTECCVAEVDVIPQTLVKIDFVAFKHGMLVGETQNAEISGTMSDGSKADLSKAKIEYTAGSTVVAVKGNQITAVQSGQGEITVKASLNGVTLCIGKPLMIAHKARDAAEKLDAGDLYKTTDYIRTQNGVLTHVTERGCGIFTNIDFGSGKAMTEIEYAAGNQEGGYGTVYIRLDHEEGPVIGTLYCKNTGGYDAFRKVPVKLPEMVYGVHDVYIRFSKDSMCAFKSICFNEIV